MDVPAADREAGFTLVETLVVLALAAVITTLIATSTGQFRKIRELDRGLQEQQQLDGVLDLITGDLRAALDLPLHSADPNRGLHFEGKADEMTFVAVVRTGFETRALREVRYFTRKANGRLELLRETKVYAASSNATPPEGATERLLPDIRSFTLSYRKSGEQVWEDGWAVERQLPRAVRVTIDRSEETSAEKSAALQDGGGKVSNGWAPPPL
ncbi:MAG: type II secretion system protein GspJ [Rhizobiaceae bacterium]|nr:type II secretion system protein GspJ [Rhizobiaceae bacterium]